MASFVALETLRGGADRDDPQRGRCTAHPASRGACPGLVVGKARPRRGRNMPMSLGASPKPRGKRGKRRAAAAAVLARSARSRVARWP